MKFILPLLLFISNAVTAQTPPGLSLVRESDLKKDVYEMCEPFFRGRGGGTIDELNASVGLQKNSGRWALSLPATAVLIFNIFLSGEMKSPNAP